MKTFWKQPLPQEKARRICADYTAKYGAPFTYYSASGGTAVLPCVDDTVTASDQGLDKVLAVLRSAERSVGAGLSFLTIASRSGLTLAEVVAVAKFINTGTNRTGGLEKFTLDICRSGKIVGMHEVRNQF